jgi:hypothetical protein
MVSKNPQGFYLSWVVRKPTGFPHKSGFQTDHRRLKAEDGTGGTDCKEICAAALNFHYCSFPLLFYFHGISPECYSREFVL